MSLVIAYSRTEVPSDKTASEIETMLQKAGVTKTGKQYESGHVKSLYFQMDTPQGSLPFRLPVNVDAVYQLMMNQYKNSAQFRYDQQYQDTLKRRVYSQAERTAWRIVHWWVKSQLALIQLNMVEISEIFLPYMLVSPDHTLYSQLKGRGDFKALIQGQSNDRPTSANG